MLTDGRERVDGTFERIERVCFAVIRHLESFVVVVPAGLTFCHDFLSRYPRIARRKGYGCIFLSLVRLRF
jgi:hypothetical protein